ncbi:MAG: type II toxin-antitoxin system Phd/YefM family antitoxin [Ruminococcaceae bacterium]|nr:type II toxin-antitoxin system Phd/YefM family antitoxin [Oscillospiraceae bacterium]
MPQIRPITDLRNTTEISDICHAQKEPVFITKNGYGDLVVMSIEAYEELIETMKVDSAIKEAEKEYNEDGMLYDARDVLPKMRSKYFG